MENKSLRPPIGLRPEWLVKEERLNEIHEAIERYVIRGYGIPSEWLMERMDIVESLNKSQEYKKSKEVKEPIPLFTSLDGKDIYEGDYYWYIDVCETGIYRTFAKRKVDPFPNVKYFSTEEKANQYILLNTPCLSVADLCQWDQFLNIKPAIIELAKQKINAQ